MTIARKREFGVTLVEVLVGLVLLAVLSLALARAIGYSQRNQLITDEKTRAAAVAESILELYKGKARDMGNSWVSEFDKLSDNAAFVSIPYEVSANMGNDVQTKFLRNVFIEQPSGEPDARIIRVKVVDRKDTKRLLAKTATVVKFNFIPQKSTQYYEVNFIPNPPPVYYPYYRSTDKRYVIQAVSNYPGQGRDIRYGPQSRNLVYGHHYHGLSYHWHPDAIDDNPADFVYLTSDWRRTDQFNHESRAPRSSGALTQAINRMADRHPDFRHMLFMNRGFIFSIPPWRNYSDAAKEPMTAARQWMRVVTHPEQLEYPSAAPVTFRVYAYVTRPDAFINENVPTLSVRFNAPIPAGDITIRRLKGNAAIDYNWDAASPGTDYTAVYGTTYTQITLLDTPLRHPYNAAQGGGLMPDDRLYGMEYIPCPPDAAFIEGERDLADDRAGFKHKPKNTARWTIRIANRPNGMLTATSRLGDVEPTDYYERAYNVSETYAWIGTAAPLTERFQFQGDPRHMPYADVKARHGYNWYFAEIDSGPGDAGYKHYDKTHDGWTYTYKYPNIGSDWTTRLNFDFPRYMSVWRTALLNSNSALVVGDPSLLFSKNKMTMAYASMGGSLGFGVSYKYPSNMAPFTISRKPWTTDGSDAPAVVNELGGPEEMQFIDPTRKVDFASQRIVARTDNSWMSIPWLGELFPDDYWPTWRDKGNLPTGAGNFYRADYSVFSSTFGYATPLSFSSQVAGAALTSLLNGSQSGGDSKYAHMAFLSESWANYHAFWRSLEDTFRVYMGRPRDRTTTRFSINRTSGGLKPPEWTDYAAERTELEIVREFMTPDGGGGDYPYVTALIRMKDPGNPARMGYVIPNGNAFNYIAPDQCEAMEGLMLVNTSYEMANPSVNIGARADPVASVVITEPVNNQEFTDPTAIDVKWTVDWKRFDGSPYTPDFPAAYAFGGPVTFNLVYTSSTSFNVWRNAATHARGFAGRKASANNVTSPFVWNVPVGDVPAGRYVLRVEAYTGSPQRYGYHEIWVEIKR